MWLVDVIKFVDWQLCDRRGANGMKWHSRAPWDSRRDRLAVLLAGGRAIKTAAEESGISERTAERWVREPAFVAHVSDLRGRMVDAAVGKVAEALCYSVEVMIELLVEENPNVRLRAAAEIRDTLIRLREHADYDDRLTRLEAEHARKTLEEARTPRTNGETGPAG
jgi:hypothetical protein